MSIKEDVKLWNITRDCRNNILYIRNEKWKQNDCFMVVLMKECEKKSLLKCLNCKREECDMKKITMILDKLDLLKEVNKEIK